MLSVVLLLTTPIFLTLQDLDGEKLQKKLQEANDKTAKSIYDAAMKCFGDCIETGSLQIRLNY